MLPKKNPLEEQKQMHLTAEELPKFLELFTTEYSAFNTIILTLLHTGMRSGECLGLQWEDIDFESKTIQIRRSMEYRYSDLQVYKIR